MELKLNSRSNNMFKFQDTKNIVLITGGAGFIGSHTVDKLIEEGRNVIVVDRNKKGFRNPKVKYYYMDINSKNLEKVFKNNDIKQVIHLAAQTSVSYSNKYPQEDAENNIIASIKLIELAKKYKIEKFIVASTAAVYANPKYLPVDEKHPLDSISPYGISKRAMEDYLKISGLNYVICRFSNVYGPRQNCEGEAGVVAIFVDKMVKGQNIQIHGDGTQTRDFIYVKDIAETLVKILEKDFKNDTINVSTNTQKSINELFENLKNITNYEKEPQYTPTRLGDIKDSVLDNRKLCSLFNLENKMSFEEGLLNTVNYLRGNKND